MLQFSHTAEVSLSMATRVNNRKEETHPLLTTAECPKRLTSRCRPGLGRTVHSSQAEEKQTHTHRFVKMMFQFCCVVVSVCQVEVRKRSVRSFTDKCTKI